MYFLKIKIYILQRRECTTSLPLMDPFGAPPILDSSWELLLDIQKVRGRLLVFFGAFSYENISP
jgi:hypothetical protein